MSSSALLTDLYELTMGYAYWKNGMTGHLGVFQASFRSNPFAGGFTIACGLETIVEYLEGFRFSKKDVDYLAALMGADGKPLFESAFLRYLSELRLVCTVDAVPEGTVVFPFEPLLRVTGPIIQAQILETALLNILNFQSLIATKAARVSHAARGDPVIEFGLRRAQGPDGGVSASRAAFVGGCAGTSNVLAGRRFGIPVKGTHAHSWVMAFPTEADAFSAYARVMPGNVVLLVDTYDTLEGVRNAITVGKRLRQSGHELLGIRLDSGDLAYLSQQARKILDKEGFPDTVILASNELDEYVIESLKLQEAAIDIWGVGTQLVTGGNQSALGGIYKLSAIKDGPGDDQVDGQTDSPAPWQPKIKVSDLALKTSVPGILQVRRFQSEGLWTGDMIYEFGSPPRGKLVLIDPADATHRKNIAAGTEWEDLLVPVFRKGRRIGAYPSLKDIQARVKEQLGRLHPGIRRFRNPHLYPVGLEPNLHDLRARLIEKARARSTA